MKRIFLIGVASIVFGASTGAFAADLAAKAPTPAPAPQITWTAVYIGGNGGCGWVRRNINTFNTNEPGDFATFSGDFAKVETACFGGGQIGANYEFANRFVVGVEADGDWGKISGSGAFVEEGEVSTFKSTLKSFGTVRGRVGYAFDTELPYVTAGWAWGRNSMTAVGDTGTATGGSATHSGWVAGFGIEHRLGAHWSARFEFLHLDLGNKNYALLIDDDAGVAPGASVHLRVDTVKVGLNYKLF